LVLLSLVLLSLVRPSFLGTNFGLTPRGVIVLAASLSITYVI
jgi:hypothetical protein